MKRNSIDCSYHIQKSYDNLLNHYDNKKIHKTQSYPIINSSYTNDDIIPSDSQNTICHIGVGNFFKSHQLSYLDQLNKYTSDKWNVIGIGVLQNDLITKNKMQKNNFNYNVVSINNSGKTSIEHIKCINNIINSYENLTECIHTLSHKSVKILSLTITEIGYSIPLNDDDIKLIQQCALNKHFDNFQNFDNITAFGLIIVSLLIRFQNNIPPFTILSCDNLLSNGILTKNKCLLEFDKFHIPELNDFISWFKLHTKFPNTMVDRITPQLNIDEIKHISKDNMLIDELPVICEEYKCWIIQDDFVNNIRPNWHLVDVKFVEKVEPYEIMKVSILNITHLYIAYLGLNNNLSFVHQVLNNNHFYILIRDFIFEDIIPVIHKDLIIYNINCKDFAETVLIRFKNQFMKDKLSRICLDGIEKFKQHSKTLLLKGLNLNLKMHNFIKFIYEFILYEKISFNHNIFKNIPEYYITKIEKYKTVGFI